MSVGEAGSSPGHFAGLVTSHGFTKEEEAGGTLKVALYISNSILMICPELNRKSKRKSPTPTIGLN